MKRTLLVLLGCALFAIKAHTQTATKFIDANNIRAKITNAGPLFWDGVDAVFAVPKTGAKGTVFAAAPWIGGMHNGQLHLMAETYRQSGRDLQQGPVASVYSANHLTYWDRIWSVSKSNLDAFKAAVQLGQIPDATTYRDIYEWPARGNVIGGDTSRAYAPFVDANNDRMYEPLDGDYPAIKGDQCMYVIMNDDIHTHTESTGKPMKIEIHRMVYAYNTPAVLSNSLFVDYSVINKSAVTYDSLLFSSFVDFDLGNYIDDYVGTDTSRNMIYAFNGDAIDDGVTGYGAMPPAQACVMLNHKLASSMYYNNTFAPVTGNPAVAADFYNFMHGKWKNGTAKHAGDSGFASSAPVTVFSYGGDPCGNTGWWEGSAGIQPGDRRIIGTLEPTTLAPEQSLNVTMAFVYARATSGDNIASMCALKGAVDSVTTWYKSGGGTTGIIDNKPEPLTFLMYPNPAKQLVTIEGAELKNAAVVVYDITGKQLKSISMQQSETISVSDLQAGLYFVRVTSEKGTATKRLIIE
ncbi:MAG: T9SS type A sorting domain-containing protein [Bacteroidota bacterium]